MAQLDRVVPTNDGLATNGAASHRSLVRVPRPGIPPIANNFGNWITARVSSVPLSLWPTALAAAALVTGAVAIYELQTLQFSVGLPLSGLAALLLYVRLGLRDPALAYPDQEAPVSSERLTVRWWALGLAAMLCLATIYLAYVEATGMLPLVPWVAGALLGIWAFRDSEGEGWERRDWTLAGVLFVLGLGSRTILLDGLPAGIHGDEADWGLLALKIWRGEAPLFAFVWLGYPGTSFVPYALTLGLLGQTITAVRLASGIVGAIAIPGLYALGRAAFGRTVGFLAGLLLLLNVANFHFSRMGLPNIEALPLAIIGGTALLAVCRRPDRWRQWAILGLSLGLCLEVYLTALVWPLVATVALAPTLVRRISTGAARTFFLGTGVAVTLALMTAAPLLTFSGHHPGSFGARGVSLTIFSSDGRIHSSGAFGLAQDDMLGILRVQIVRSLGLLHSQRDTSLQYGSQRGMLDPVAGVAFVLGLAVLARLWRRPVALLLAAWFAFTLFLGSVILVDPPFAPRLVLIVPVACLTAAAGLERLWLALQSVAPRRLVFGPAAAVACALIGASLGFSYYFGEYWSNYPNQAITAEAWYIRSVQSYRTVYFVGLGEPTNYVTLQFMAPNAQVLRWELDQPAPPPATHQQMAFLMPLQDEAGARAPFLVGRIYPAHRERFLTNAVGDHIIRLWEVPADAPE